MHAKWRTVFLRLFEVGLLPRRYAEETQRLNEENLKMTGVRRDLVIMP